MCFYYDDCGIELIDSSYRMARKAHVCDMCGRSIPPKTEYENQVSKDGRTLCSHKTCNLCLQDIHLIARHEFREGCRWHDAWCRYGEDLMEYKRENPDWAWATTPTSIDDAIAETNRIYEEEKAKRKCSEHLEGVR